MSSFNQEDRQASSILAPVDIKWGDLSYIGVPTRFGEQLDSKGLPMTQEIEISSSNVKFGPEMVSKQKEKNKEIYNILKNIRESAFKKDNKEDPAYVTLRILPLGLRGDRFEQQARALLAAAELHGLPPTL